MAAVKDGRNVPRPAVCRMDGAGLSGVLYRGTTIIRVDDAFDRYYKMTTTMLLLLPRYSLDLLMIDDGWLGTRVLAWLDVGSNQVFTHTSAYL